MGLLSGQRDIDNLVCPFMLLHVASGTAFSSTCDYLEKDCVYSETNWDGGVIPFRCIKEKCMLWDPEVGDCILFSGSKAIPSKPAGSGYALDTAIDLLIEISEKIRSEDMPEPLYSVVELIKHLHDSHCHVDPHSVTEIPADPGADVTADSEMPDAAVLANEWLNQQDLNGDGDIYGPSVEGPPPVLKSLRNHPDWDDSWSEGDG